MKGKILSTAVAVFRDERVNEHHVSFLLLYLNEHGFLCFLFQSRNHVL